VQCKDIPTEPAHGPRRHAGGARQAGAPCGCRGDFEITDKGLAQIGEARTAKMLLAGVKERRRV